MDDDPSRGKPRKAASRCESAYGHRKQAKKKIAAEEDASKAARIVRDYLAKARVLLISLKPTITISEAHHHPLVNSELPCFLSFFDSRFSISNRTIRLHLPMQLQQRPFALPMLGCSRGRSPAWDVL
jgi:hypothetical protein